MFYLGWFTVYHDIGVNHITVPSWYYQPELYRSGIQAPLGASRCAYDLNVTHQLAPIGAWSLVSTVIVCFAVESLFAIAKNLHRRR